jgi:dihydrofolate synthase/folylpolyglutamate synthase
MISYSGTLDKIYQLRGGMIDLRLDRMDRALALFGRPEKQFPSIHVAGTNGKGSTSAMLHRVLTLAGYRTALYTSPHLASFTERIRVGDDEISEDTVITLADEIWQRTTAADLSLTFFEFVTIMAFVHFARREIDVAVIEVGLGGRLDATNVITPMVSIITTISKDHEAYLGPNLLSIAREKAGIIKPGVPVVCGKLSAEVVQLLRGIADERGSTARFLGSDYGFSLKNEGLFDYTGIKRHYLNLNVGLRGRHQRTNAAAAIAALELVGGRFLVNESVLRDGLKNVCWPGRFEVMFDHPTVVLDGAHNSEGVNALVDELNDFRQGRNVKLLFAAMADKEWELMSRALTKVVNEIVFTRVAMERSADPQQLAASLNEPVPRRAIGNSRVALKALLDEAHPDDIIVVAGSLYLVGEVRPMVLELAATKAGGVIEANRVAP